METPESHTEPSTDGQAPTPPDATNASENPQPPPAPDLAAENARLRAELAAARHGIPLEVLGTHGSPAEIEARALALAAWKGEGAGPADLGAGQRGRTPEPPADPDPIGTWLRTRTR